MKALSLILVLSLLFSPVLFADQGGNTDIKQLEKLYDQVEFEQVVIKGTALLEHEQLSSEDSLAVIRLLAMAAAKTNKPDLCKTYLLKQIDMDFCTDYKDNEMSTKFRNIWFAVQKETKFVPCKKREMLTVAIVEFDNGSFVDADKVANMGKGICEMVRYDMQATDDVYVPSREHINYLVDELKLSQTELADQSVKLEVGKVVGAKNFIFGTFYNLPKNKFRIDARVIDTETTLPKKQFTVEGKSKKMDELIFELTKQILEYFNVEAEKIKEASAKIPEVNLAALNKFSLGMTYEEMGEWELAKKLYSEVLEIAPAFTLASTNMERVELEIRSLGQ